MDEVRFGRMTPRQILQRRRECPVAYLPVGVLEWHGDHLPMGTDYLTVEDMSLRAAREVGGVAFPPLMYCDDRTQLLEVFPEWRDIYTRDMGVPEKCAARDRLPFTDEDQHNFWVEAIARTICEIHHYGFPNIVLLPGHGPSPPVCRKAEARYASYAEQVASLQPKAETRTVFYIDFCQEYDPDYMPKNWIHADKLETSVVMATAPETVDLEALPEDPDVIPSGFLGQPWLDPRTGYNPDKPELHPYFDKQDPRNGSSAEYGEERVQYAISRIGAVVQEMLAGGESGEPDHEEQ